MEHNIWPYDQGLYKLFIQEEDIKDEILTWEECLLQCRYYNVQGRRGWDIIFPVRYYKQVEKLLKRKKKK
jgi:hypothetical protein